MSISRAGTCSAARNRYCFANGRPAASCVPTTLPAEVPSTRSASPSGMSAASKAASTPVSHETPVSPPPPRTTARRYTRAPMVIASYAFDVTLALIIVFGGIGLLLNAIIVYAVVQALGERKQNREAAERAQTLGPRQG